MYSVGRAGASRFVVVVVVVIVLDPLISKTWGRDLLTPSCGGMVAAATILRTGEF